MNNNKFLTLLMGECWHEWKPTSGHVAYTNTPTHRYDCVKCGKIVFSWKETKEIDHLSNPLPVIRWMEKEMPEVWEDYVDSQFVLFRYDKKEAYECLNKVLDLSNLITYLSEHREWGWDNYETERGRIKHPALVYLEASCEIK